MNDKNQLSLLWTTHFRSKNKASTSRIEFFRKISFFEGLSTKQLNVVSKFLHERQYEENECLFEVSHPGAALFIISRGEVVIEVGQNTGNVEAIATIKPGEFLGEMALLDDSPRSATARAKVPTHAYALSRAELNRLGKEDPVVALEIYKSLAWVIGERLKATNRFAGKRERSAA